MPIKSLQKRLTEVGRLRLGQKVPVMDQRTGKQKIRNGQPVFRPARGQTWRVTTRHEELLQYVAGRYGGEVKPWEGAPSDEPQWELLTDSAVLEVIIPPGKLRLSQWMETWQRNLCVRRCDTETETNSDGPCICATEASHPKDYACQPVTRLSVMLQGIPSAGVWRAELHGIHGAEELAGMAELLEAAGAAGRIVPATLALEQRTIPAKPSQPTRHIVLAVLQPLPAWIEEQVALQGRAAAGALTAPQRELEAPDYDAETGEVYDAVEEESPEPEPVPIPAGSGAATPATRGTAVRMREAQAEATATRQRHDPTPSGAPTLEQIQTLKDPGAARALWHRSDESYQVAVVTVVTGSPAVGVASQPWKRHYQRAALEAWQVVLAKAVQTSGAGNAGPPAAPAPDHPADLGATSPAPGSASASGPGRADRPAGEGLDDESATTPGPDEPGAVP